MFVVLKTATVVGVVGVLDCVVWSVSVYSRFVFSFFVWVLYKNRMFFWEGMVVVVAISVFYCH